MPPPPAKKPGGKGGPEGDGKKKKKEPPKELCGCGADTYRPPPKGKKLTTAPVEHNPGCNYQRTTCDAYPYLPRCEVCLQPCSYCGGKNRWCPHCYEIQCHHRYKRVVHGWEPPSIDAGPGNPTNMATGPNGFPAAPGGLVGGNSTGGRRSIVKFVDGGDAGNSVGRTKRGSVSFVPAS